MSVGLIVEVLDTAPAELTSAERVLLLVLAEQARDGTRQCYPGMRLLARRSGLSARRVRQVLAQFAERGYELRVATGTDRNGEPTFAHKGRATVYRIPWFGQRRQSASPLKGAEVRHLWETKGEGSGTQRGKRSAAKGEEDFPPPVKNPQGTVKDPASARVDDEIATVIKAIQDRTGKKIDSDHAKLVIKQLVGERNGVRDRRAYLVGAIHKDADPHRFLPTPGPPPFRREDFQ
jgi:hypothetical protein